MCGLTDNDLYADLRLRGVFDLGELQHVLYETKGGLSLVRKTQGDGLPLVAAGLAAATGQAGTR